ncbi:hypothetical protein CERZMDRAFT_96389 [Cercospora zeae-maydis SCOH1-5]|uniref:F-box domain-containing protein n=1 Tax=Cercospora zeae-maydis SCOH1-5 TaxID=717836 RepID=A0A6A6FJE9_9PEZI|nr:hypothetical protein CERZMDRAFT_96389 [Cercospora zeae-maydis SCOH1-5]
MARYEKSFHESFSLGQLNPLTSSSALERAVKSAADMDPSNVLGQQRKKHGHGSPSQNLESVDRHSQQIGTGSVESTRKTKAARNVCGTFELLEMILLSCHPRDLLIFQRVSPFWRGVIMDSKPLQNAMWLLDTATPLRPTYNDDIWEAKFSAS